MTPAPRHADDPMMEARVAAHALSSAVGRLIADVSLASLGVGFHRQVRAGYVPTNIAEIRGLLDAVEAAFPAEQPLQHAAE